MRHKIISVCLILWLVFALPVTTFAQGLDANQVGSISITLMEQGEKEPIVGAELSVYYVASVMSNSRNNLSYIYTNVFESCGAALDDPSLSVKLDAFVEEHSVSATKIITDSQGRAVFSNLPLGLYFVKQTNSVKGYAPCVSFLVTVPNKTADGYVYDVNASPKTDVEKLTDITIKKIWNTDESAKIAENVTVHLLQDGIVIKTAILNHQNNWSVTFSDMQESDSYSIIEVSIPKGFTATYTQQGYEFAVINSASLIQTGQISWPIPVFAMAGLILITIGTIILCRLRNNNA